MMNEITGISIPHLRAPCNSILDLGIRLPPFFVMCPARVARLSVFDKTALDNAISQLPDSASSITRPWSAWYIDPGRNKSKNPHTSTITYDIAYDIVYHIIYTYRIRKSTRYRILYLIRCAGAG